MAEYGLLAEQSVTRSASGARTV